MFLSRAMDVLEPLQLWTMSEHEQPIGNRETSPKSLHWTMKCVVIVPTSFTKQSS